MTSPPTVVSLDFRAPAVPNRLGFLDGDNTPFVHVALHQSAQVAADLPTHVDGIVADADLPDSADVVVVTYCASFALLPAITAALVTRGHRVTATVAIDASVLDEAEVWTVVDDVAAQLGAPGSPAERPVRLDDHAAVRATLADHVDAVVAPFGDLVLTALGISSPDDPAKTVADDLLARYRTWFGHVIACYAAAGDAPLPSTRFLHTADRDSGIADPGQAVSCRDWDELVHVALAEITALFPEGASRG